MTNKKSKDDSDATFVVVASTLAGRGVGDTVTASELEAAGVDAAHLLAGGHIQKQQQQKAKE